MRYIQNSDDGKLYPHDEYVEKFGKPRQRVKQKTNIQNKFFDAYESHASGQVITNHKQRDNDMKEHNCIEYDPAFKAECDQNAKNEELALELKIDRDVERSISELTVDQQGSLEQELNAGMDIEIDRR